MVTSCEWTSGCFVVDVCRPRDVSDVLDGRSASQTRPSGRVVRPPGLEAASLRLADHVPVPRQLADDRAEHFRSVCPCRVHWTSRDHDGCWRHVGDQHVLVASLLHLWTAAWPLARPLTLSRALDGQSGTVGRLLIMYTVECDGISLHWRSDNKLPIVIEKHVIKNCVYQCWCWYTLQ